ncbi:MAG: photosynthetic complex putative assembly protein PuhB [Pseudomonadota bacterium]
MEGDPDITIEPIEGLPAHPPAGEHILWQGRPGTVALAREALKLGWVLGYFGLLILWRASVAMPDGAGAVLAAVFPLAILAAAVSLILLAMAWAMARATVYTITSARVMMRIGAALTVTLNLPFRQIDSADLALRRNGTGTIALTCGGENRLSYFICWPHARPWHLGRAQPALRGIPDAQAVATLLADAAARRVAVLRGTEPAKRQDQDQSATAAGAVPAE